MLCHASEKRAFPLSAAEDRKYKQYAQKCSEVGIQFVPLVFESFEGFSETVRETLKRITTLAEHFGRLSQSASFTEIRGSVITLLARDARSETHLKRQPIFEILSHQLRVSQLKISL